MELANESTVNKTQIQQLITDQNRILPTFEDRKPWHKTASFSDPVSCNTPTSF